MLSTFRRAVTAVAAVATATLLAACGSSSSAGSSSTASSPPSSAAPSSAAPSSAAPSSAAPSSSTPFKATPDPCSILTNAQIAAVTGSDPGPGTRDTSLRGCSYAGGIQLLIDDAAKFDQTQADLTTAGITMTSALTGVGDKAVYGKGPKGTAIVLLSAYGQYLIGVAADLTPQQAGDLANAVIDQLPSS